MLLVGSCFPDYPASPEDIAICQCPSYSGTPPPDPGLQPPTQFSVHGPRCGFMNAVPDTFAADNHIPFLTPGNFQVLLSGITAKPGKSTVIYCREINKQTEL